MGCLRRFIARVSEFLLFLVLLGPANSVAEQRYSIEQIFNAFNQDHPGRGVDSYDYKEADHAMGYALYACAAVLNGDFSHAQTALDWLAANNNDGKGWGLPFSWDAFSDGSVNPESTIYGITVAWGIKAFLDYAEQTGSNQYDGVARSVLDYYQSRFTATSDGGYFWYSSSGFDNKNVRNVSSMLAGQYARAGKYFSRQDYADIARLAFQSVWAARKDDDSTTRWTYSDFSSAPNDSIHAAYLVYGLSVYARTNDLKLDLDGAYRLLSGFSSAGKAYEFSSFEQVKSGLKERAARSWGVGMLAFVFADAKRTAEASGFVQNLAVYEYRPGHFGLTEGDTHFFPRAQGHIALGLVGVELAR